VNEDLLAKIGGKPDDYPHQIEARFGRVFERIVALWGSEQFDPYINSLFIAERSDRQGFPDDAMAELFRLSRLHDAARQQAEKAELWEAEALKRGLADLNFEVTAGGFTSAIERDHDGALQLFLLAGMDLEARNSQGWTPLMVAAFHGSANAAERLIRAGADVRAYDYLGYAPLHWAAVQGYARVVALLLDKGASADAQSQSGITPLLQAAANGHVDCVAALLKLGASPSLADKEGWTPLHKATANCYLDIVRLLIAHGANPFAEQQGGTRPIDIAKHLRNTELMLALRR
jgi:uncharacterized protein